MIEQRSRSWHHGYLFLRLIPAVFAASAVYSAMVPGLPLPERLVRLVIAAALAVLVAPRFFGGLLRRALVAALLAALGTAVVRWLLVTGAVTAMAGAAPALPLDHWLPWVPGWVWAVLGLLSVPANFAFWTWRGRVVRATMTAAAPLLVTLDGHRWLLPVLAVILGVLLALAAVWAVWPQAADSPRRLRRVKRRWHRTSRDVGLGETVLDRTEREDGLWRLYLRLADGKAASDARAAVARLEATWGVRPGSVQVFPDETHAGRVRVDVSHVDRLAKPVPMPSHTPPSIKEPVWLGIDERGALVKLSLVGQHLLIAGLTGAGKSTCLEVLLRNLGGMTDVECWAVDLKRVELSRHRDRLTRLATEPADATRLLYDARDELERRSRLLADEGAVMWQPTEERKALAIVVDELAELPKEAKGALDSVARLGRALGVILVAATQRPSVQALGQETGGSLRAMMTATIGLQVRTPAESTLIFGGGSAAGGWCADKLTGGKGRFLLRDPGHQTPVVARCFWPGAEGGSAPAQPSRARPRITRARWRSFVNRTWHRINRKSAFYLRSRLARTQRRLPRSLAIVLAYVTLTRRWYRKDKTPRGLRKAAGKRRNQ